IRNERWGASGRLPEERLDHHPEAILSVQSVVKNLAAGATSGVPGLAGGSSAAAVSYLALT
ncbi:MAG: hypothetical protein NTW21_28280, partial [Verrucomicrobia bacterium]|nr:hypothetical protein [Verrucomicrobiota bacterium]